MRHHVAADLQQLRKGAQAAHDAAGRQRVADRLIDAVAFRYVDLALDRFVAADQHADDHVVSAVERRGAIVMHRIGGLRVTAVATDALDDATRVREPFAVDVDQREVRIAQMRIRQNVGGQPAGEHQAACTDDCYTRHAAPFHVCRTSTDGFTQPPSMRCRKYTSEFGATGSRNGS